MNRDDIRVSERALEIQKDYMAAVRAQLPKGMKYHIVTLGCQMNVRDSETLAGMLTQMGFAEAPAREDADIILYNTCCVRENAENKALGNVIWLKELKKLKSDLIIAVCGCMMQEKGVADMLKRKYPFIDLVFGTHNAYRFPEYLKRVIDERAPVIEVEETSGVIAEGLPVRRSSPYFAFVNVMYGCDNFCSYCIVPYVRGSERSRDMGDVLDECARLKDAGVQEIMLLGQNVNSYMGGGAKFTELLKRVNALGIPRVRFMTSHPKDLSDELIRAYGELEHLMPNLHLPVQAGNDDILNRMNRRYTRADYLKLVGKLRAARPDIGITSDIIVGFPGETRAQFEDTLSLAREARFDAAYTFIYSPREGTRAAQMPDDTPMDEKTRRIQQLIELQQSISLEILTAQQGKVETVLVDSVSTRGERFVGGKTPRGHMVNFEGDISMIGRMARVKILSAGKNTLKGERVEAEGD